MNKYNIKVTRTFVKMFKSEFYKYTRYSSAYALKIEKKIYEALSLLELFPYVTPCIKFRNKRGSYREITVMKRFYVVFKIADNVIYLLYFIDGRQAPKNYFKKKS